MIVRTTNVVLFCFVASLCQTEALNVTMSDLKNAKDKLKDVSSYVMAAKSALDQNDPQKFLTQIGKLVGMIPGPVGAIAGGVIGLVAVFLPTQEQVTELGLILDQLKAVSSRMDALSQTILETKSELIMEIRLQALAKYENALGDIDSNYQKLLAKNTDVSRDRLINTCHKEGYNNLARWFRNEVLGSHATSGLVQEIRKKNDRKLYFTFTKTLVGNFLKATVLQTACTSAIYANRSSDELQDALKYDSDDYQKMLTEIKERIASEDSSIVNDFWVNAQSDVETLMVGKDNTDHKVIADVILSSLKVKYYWREWYVAVYGDGSTGTFKNHQHNNHEVKEGTGVNKYGDYASYFRLWVRYHNRNIALSSPDGNNTSEFRSKASDCLGSAIQSKWLVEACSEAVDLLMKCMGNVRYNVVGCARDMKNYAHAETGDASIYRKVVSSHTGGFTAQITITHYYDLYFAH